MNEVSKSQSSLAAFSSGTNDMRNVNQGGRGAFKNSGLSYRTPAYGGRNPNDKQFASQVYGDIARKDWWDYQDTFMPIHGKFRDLVQNDSLTLEQLDRIPGIVDKSFAKNHEQVAARNARMGIDSKQSASTELSKGLAEVYAENQARQHGKERRMSAIAGANLSPQSARVNQ